jgi:hypothetical protein
MDEKRWLYLTDPRLLLDYCRRQKPKPSDRKLRLLCVACCRRLWSVMEEPCRRTIEVAERLADAQATAEEMAAAHAVIIQRNRGVGGMHRRSPRPEEVPTFNSWSASEGTTRPGPPNVGKTLFETSLVAITRWDLKTDQQDLAELVREIFGNPFHRLEPLGISSSTVAALAREAYEARDPAIGALDPARLAVLADAAEEAGLRRADVLVHLREDRPHVRGCWALDLILGRT